MIQRRSSSEGKAPQPESELIPRGPAADVFEFAAGRSMGLGFSPASAGMPMRVDSLASGGQAEELGCDANRERQSRTRFTDGRPSNANRERVSPMVAHWLGGCTRRLQVGAQLIAVEGEPVGDQTHAECIAMVKAAAAGTTPPATTRMSFLPPEAAAPDDSKPAVVAEVAQSGAAETAADGGDAGVALVPPSLLSSAPDDLFGRDPDGSPKYKWAKLSPAMQSAGASSRQCRRRPRSLANRAVSDAQRRLSGTPHRPGRSTPTTATGKDGRTVRAEPHSVIAAGSGPANILGAQGAR